MNDSTNLNISDIQRFPCRGINLSPYNISVPDRLEKFGYTVILDCSSSGRTEKAELCVNDVLTKKVRPNIIIFCPADFMPRWYFSMLHDIGTEFKYLNFDEGDISFFNRHCANMYIADCSRLEKSDDCATVREIRNSGIIWDLIIIDFPFSAEGADTGIYISELRCKTEKLIICAPAPSKYNEDCGNISALAKHLLYNKEQAQDADLYPVDVTVLDFNPAHPVLADNGQELNEYKINTLYYTVDESLTQKNKRITDAKTNMPIYTQGGNIFEEYSLEERRTYLFGEYNADDINVLCAVDKKLEVFISAVKEAVFENCTVMVYAVFGNTVNYLYKALNSIFYNDNRNVRVKVLGASGMNAKTDEAENGSPLVLIANDDADRSSFKIKNVTHIFNYEYPCNPAILQTRYMRRGCGNNPAPVFHIFIDTDCRFDGRFLRKAVLSNLHLAFHKRIPLKNILMFAEDIDKHITALLLDLKVIYQYTGEEGSSLETAARFKSEYSLSDEENIATSAEAHEKAGKILKTLTAMLNITGFENITDEKRLYEEVVEKVSVMRFCYGYFDGGGRLRFMNKGNNSLYDEYAGFLEENRFVKGVRQSEKGLENFSADDIPRLREIINPLSDTMKMAILFSMRKFCSERSFIKLMKLYNRGIM